jgi:hypothetical protein
MEISRTDLNKLIKYLDDAAKLYDKQRGQRYVCRAWCLRRMIEKLNKKLYKNDKTGHNQ